ncbi:sigma-54-dependent transcriptional regulator [Gimesia panareensis]|uniref:sigma-54-dependent transcriptional regulator n=1 Tax=Gimesia panareensis TaxID=2527978 RepID=UPI001189C1CF|nr:sigma 54-interacting transcriptional regulator [Gimesia panareensis]QDU49717.1 Transcriptional regulatory protein ZraR [Gimesia panareensis]
MKQSIIHQVTSRGVIQVVSEDRIRRLEICTQLSNLGYTVVPLAEMLFSAARQHTEAEICLLLDAKAIAEYAFKADAVPEEHLIPVLFYPPFSQEQAREHRHSGGTGLLAAMVPFAELKSEDSLENIGRLLDSAIKYARLSRRCSGLVQELNSRSTRKLIGYSQAIQTLRDRVADATHLQTPVVVQGIAGTELSLVAELIHDAMFLEKRPFIKVNCSSLTIENVERELLGYFTDEKSSYTDEPKWNPGRFELAEGGTLVLDQMHLASLPVQAAILKIVEQDEYLCPEDSQVKKLNCRLISISHVPLSELVAQNQFKRKLASILGETTISVPRLNDRKEDLALLTEFLLSEVARAEGTVPKLLTLDGLETLKRHDWTGDVQELRNLIQHVSRVDNGVRLDAASLQPWIGSESIANPDSMVGMTLREMEQKLIESTFARCGGNREQTAQMLDIGLRTLSGKLRSYGYPPRGGPDSKRSFTVRRAA